MKIEEEEEEKEEQEEQIASGRRGYFPGTAVRSPTWDFSRQRLGSTHLPLTQSGSDCAGEVLCRLQGLTTP